ncbi:MAG TPA: hypothetical protein VGO78_09205, partial [Acidimicrobiales bacterium]|nr:hypothetical protein [Acidimicrobiales bacterium]
MSPTTEKQLKKASLWNRLYHGETNFDIIGKRRWFFIVSGVVVLIGLGSLATRGLHLGIEFEGGVVWEVPAGDASIADTRDALDQFGLADAKIQTLGGDDGDKLQVQAEAMDPADSDKVTAALADVTGSNADDISLTEV